MQRSIFAYAERTGIAGRSVMELCGSELVESLLSREPGRQIMQLVAPSSVTTRPARGSNPVAKESTGREVSIVNQPIPEVPPLPVIGPKFVISSGRVSSGFKSDPSQRARQVREIMTANGQWPPVPGRAYVIQIDQDSPPASATKKQRREYLKSYSGHMIVFSHQEGRSVELGVQGPWESASHTGRFTAPVKTKSGKTISVSVDGDSWGELAHIRSDVYEYYTKKRKDRFRPTTKFENSARDLNHNGVIDGKEKKRRFTATQIQIHAGNKNSPKSTGCQTLRPLDFKNLSDAIKKANSANLDTFTYILVRRPNEKFPEPNPF